MSLDSCQGRRKGGGPLRSFAWWGRPRACKVVEEPGLLPGGRRGGGPYRSFAWWGGPRACEVVEEPGLVPGEEGRRRALEVLGVELA